MFHVSTRLMGHVKHTLEEKLLETTPALCYLSDQKR